MESTGASNSWPGDGQIEIDSPAGPIRVLLADDRLLAVGKPSGLLSVPGIGLEKADCLVARLQGAFPGARIVHRLDRDTSGIMVLGLDAETHRMLSIQFQEREVRKWYRAWVSGRIDVDEGVIEEPLRKDLDHPPRQIIDRVQGRSALTRFRVDRRDQDRSLVTLMPVTGRSHQLRVHMTFIGHPILGDDLYAPPEVLAMAPRLMLHAERLELCHPGSGERMSLSDPAPF